MRVLLGVDGSQASDLAASLVANLAWPVGSTIDVLIAHPGSADTLENVGMMPPIDVARERENAVEVAAQGIAGDAARRFVAPDLTVETRVVCDRPSKAILDEAARIEADLIVLGNRGHGAIESAVIGSTCLEVVDQSHRRVALQNLVETHLLDHHAPVFDLAPWHHLQSLDQGLCLRAAV